jgi:GNAT superfamily N-acetyltransferase
VYDNNSVRLQRFNTLESYGPVHRWGDWTPLELFDIAKTSKYVADDEDWVCTTDGSRDGYGRVLVDCPGAAEHLVREGHAHVFAMDTAADPKLLKIQKEAQEKGVGMWAKGVPSMIFTSLHSAAEDYAKEKGFAYNRMVSSKTGASTLMEHDDEYGTCEEICSGTKEDLVCMTYVPFEIRYRGKPDCLRVPKKKSDGSKTPETGGEAPTGD